MSVEPASKHCRTLIVEDDRISRIVLGRLVRLLGHEPISAGTVAEGFAMLDQHPGCVILDLMLPDGSGATLLRRIREEHLPIKVAIATGTCDPDLISQVQALHPDAFFRKPVDLAQLTHWLDHVN